MSKNNLDPKMSLNEDFTPKRAVEKILGYAVSQEAESILVDLSSEYPAIFYKFFGNWKKMFDLPENMGIGVKTEIKRLANIEKIDDSIPQAGSFKITYEGYKIIFQVSANPINKGEKIFIEFFKDRSKLFTLRQLGLQRSALNVVQKNLKKNSGISAVLGNFNSGRTATLYSLLDYLNRPELNVCTIENEIDYDLPFVNQARLDLKAGFDYSLALSSLLKQDPDIIMIGDISDKETAENSFQAADRGYPVLVGLYSQNVVTAFTFFRDLGLSLPLFLKVVNMFLNQRVVKKVCHHCILKDKKDAAKIKDLKSQFDLKFLLPKLKEMNVVSEKIKSFDDLTFYKGKGCDRCQGTGFSGSIGVFEVLNIDEEVRTLIKNGHLSRTRNEIRRQGGFFMEEDALIKAINGVTTIDEVLRVAKE